MIIIGIFGGQEILVIAGMVLLLFGGKKLPELMRGLGKGVREFKNATNSIKDEIEEANPVNDLKNIGEKEHKEVNGKKG